MFFGTIGESGKSGGLLIGCGPSPSAALFADPIGNDSLGADRHILLSYGVTDRSINPDSAKAKAGLARPTPESQFLCPNCAPKGVTWMKTL